MPPGGSTCNVASCKNTSEKAKKCGLEIIFHSFPTDPHIRKEWIRKCYRKDKFTPRRICSTHFLPSDYEDELEARLMGYRPKKLLKNAIPSLLLLSPVPAELPKVSPRGLRWQVKQNKLLVKSLIDKSEDPLEPLESSTVLVAGENEDDIGGMTASCNTSDSLGLKLSALGNSTSFCTAESVSVKRNYFHNKPHLIDYMGNEGVILRMKPIVLLERLKLNTLPKDQVEEVLRSAIDKFQKMSKGRESSDYRPESGNKIIINDPVVRTPYRGEAQAVNRDKFNLLRGKNRNISKKMSVRQIEKLILDNTKGPDRRYLLGLMRNSRKTRQLKNERQCICSIHCCGKTVPKKSGISAKFTGNVFSGTSKDSGIRKVFTINKHLNDSKDENLYKELVRCIYKLRTRAGDDAKATLTVKIGHGSDLLPNDNCDSKLSNTHYFPKSRKAVQRSSVRERQSASGKPSNYTLIQPGPEETQISFLNNLMLTSCKENKSIPNKQDVIGDKHGLESKITIGGNVDEISSYKYYLRPPSARKPKRSFSPQMK